MTTKLVEASTLADLETAVNTFLGTLDAKDILDVIITRGQTGKYGSQVAYFAAVVYKA